MRLEHELRAESTQTEHADSPVTVAFVQHCDGGLDGDRAAPEHRPSTVAFNFGAGRREGGRLVETTYGKVPGVSAAATGYEVLDRRGQFVSWHECVLDACDSLKRRVVFGKVVRCSDRALLKLCKSPKGRL